jgi:hypothetical protein
MQWAINHLKTMSDSGVYETLKLESIESAATQVSAEGSRMRALALSGSFSPSLLLTFSFSPLQDGIFHYNTHVTVKLSSPHLLDGAASSTHRLLIMIDKEDRTRSFAIDAFPMMEPDAIEEFWMRKVDAHRARREIEFRKLAWEAKQAAKERTAGECVDLCEERATAAREYRYLSDEEFFQIEEAERLAQGLGTASIDASGRVRIQD